MKLNAIPLLGLIWLGCGLQNPQEPLKPFTPLVVEGAKTLQTNPGTGTALDSTNSSARLTPRESGVSEVLGVESVLQLRGGIKIWPSDYRIGPVYALLGPEERAAKDVLESFLKSLVDKNPKLDLIQTQWRVPIQETLELQKENWPISFRIGKIILESEGMARATVGFTGVAGRTEGWVYLERQKAIWKLSDWQVDLFSISKKESPGDFEPEGYPFINGYP